jgi:hypothetical protein
MNIEVAEVAVAVEITPGATGALANTFPQLLKQDGEVISVDLTIAIEIASDDWLRIHTRCYVHADTQAFAAASEKVHIPLDLVVG